MDSAKQSGPPPHVVLMQMVQGLMVSKALQAVAELGIADLLADSAKTVEELARATSTNPSALFRLLRAMASLGIFRQNESGLFENTTLSEPLRSDSSMSIRDYVIYAANEGNERAWMQLMSVLKTEKPSFAEANGCELWDYFQQHPDLGERFNRAMTSLASGNTQMVLRAYDFSPFKTLIDVGGGQGQLLAGILKACPNMRGTLFDLPAVVQGAQAYFAAQGVGDRCTVVAGDAFSSIPAGFEAYVLKNVLHDWSDDRCALLLERVRTAIPPQGKLIIVDTVMVPGNEPHPAKWSDLHMMVAVGGRERTEEDFRRLLKRCDFSLTMAKPLLPPTIAMGIVEAIPA
jgi:hypothetical protein